MSSGTEANTPEPEGLQFDHAEFDQAGAPAAVACSACNRPIGDRYFEINGTIVCEPCRHAIESQLRGGSGAKRYVRALVYGIGAAIAGAALYSAFLIFSPIDLSLLAILIGFIVGKMVRKGSGGLGGLPYQLLAVFLTYSSLGLTYLTADLARFFRENKGALVMLNSPMFYVECLKILYKIPVLRMSASPIMIAFVGFAIWEAWKFNKPLQLVVTGPYRVGEMGTAEGGLANA